MVVTNGRDHLLVFNGRDDGKQITSDSVLETRAKKKHDTVVKKNHMYEHRMRGSISFLSSQSVNV